MNINRHNYEEYFLLYVDNELPAAEKNMVEAFIAQNPDLEEELLMLQQSIIQPDGVVFPDKKSLVKLLPADAGTEEKLLLLADNELPENEKQQFLTAIKNDKNLSAAWQLLQQTKLSPADSIVFEEKELLYRKEKNRVVAVKWWQLAAAALLIGAGLWGTVSYLSKDNKSISTETAGSQKNIIPGNTIKPGNENRVIPGKEEEKPVTNAVVQTIKKDDKTTAPVINTNKKIFPADKNKDVVQQTGGNNLPRPVYKNINNDESNKQDAVIVSPQKQEINIVSANDESPRIKPIAAVMPLENTTAAVDSNKDPGWAFDEEEDNSPKKSKMGGLFKKVKRVIERKTKIKTGSNDEIRIANMSFAMH